MSYCLIFYRIEHFSSRCCRLQLYRNTDPKIDSKHFAPNTIYVRNKVCLKSYVYIGSWISLEYYNSSCSLRAIDTTQVTPSYWIESCYRVRDRYFPVATGLSHRRFAELVHPPLGVHSLMTAGQRPTKMQPTNCAKLHPLNHNFNSNSANTSQSIVLVRVYMQPFHRHCYFDIYA